MTSNTKALMALDQLLLERLSANTGNLLDDEELIGEHKVQSHIRILVYAYPQSGVVRQSLTLQGT